VSGVVPTWVMALFPFDAGGPCGDAFRKAQPHDGLFHATHPFDRVDG
jgi:hypothetical protein